MCLLMRESVQIVFFPRICMRAVYFELNKFVRFVVHCIPVLWDGAVFP
jgi:hypothetical protein